MKNFEEINFDIAICRQELNELKQHLDNKTELKERKDVLPFFQKTQG
ncbi:hypothetical protein [Geitlerinema sp. P-1104]|nr:hypothetical protein [Geitlerinema sp. P-1104]